MSITFLHLCACFSSKKRPVKDLAKVAEVKPLDAIIVPGVPFKNGNWDTVMKARVLWSYVLYKNGYTRNIIYSGSSVYTAYYESKIMALYAEQLGIPKEHIRCETRARHSTENVYYSYLLAQKEGFRSLGLATDPFQSGLLRGFTRKRFGTKIYHLPFITDSVKKYNSIHVVIDPASARADSFTSITEKESYWERLKGTLGRDIDWRKYKHRKVPAL